MDEILIVFTAIPILFFAFLAIKKILTFNVCVVCLSISTVWAAGLLLFWNGFFESELILALLMGQSIVGLYYLAEKKVSEKFHVFRLPFILTLMLLAYIAISIDYLRWDLYALLVSVWVVFGIVFFFRNFGLKGLAKSVIECCRDW